MNAALMPGFASRLARSGFPAGRFIARRSEFFGSLFSSTATDSDYKALIKSLAINEGMSYESLIRQCKALGLTEANVISILRKLPYYKKMGYPITVAGYKLFGSSLKKSLSKIPAVGIGYVVRLAASYVASHKSSIYTNIINAGSAGIKELESTGKAASTVSEAIKNAATGAASSLDAWAKFVEFMNKHGKKIAIGGGALAVLFLLGYSGVGPALFGGTKRAINYVKNPISPQAANAARKYREFNSFPVSRWRSIPMPDCSHLALLGSGLEIGYRSSKWTGRSQDYLHKFGRGVKLYATPDGKTLVLQGGKLDVKDVGIIN